MNIKNKIVSGILWKGLERIGAQLVSTIVSIYLARRLVPDDYSVVSIVSIFFAFCNLLISSGLNTALIQKKHASELDYSTVFITNEFFAIVMYLVMFFCAPMIANFYDKDLLIPVIRIMSLSFFINGYKSVLCSKISSEMRFKGFFFATLIGTLVSAIVGVTMAYKGYGAWSLVFQQLVNCFIDTFTLAIYTRYFFKLRFSIKSFIEMINFGGSIIVTSIISTIYDECRPLIVGKKFSTNELAFYNKGMMFPGLFNSIGNNTLAATLFPAMSQYQDDYEMILSISRRFMKVSSFIVFPMMAGFAAISNSFVSVVLTDKWLPIVPYIILFSISYAFDLLQVGNIQAIKAIGKTNILLKTEIIKKSVYFVIIAIFVLFSQSALMLAASSLITTVWATLVNIYPSKKYLKYGYKDQLKDILPNLITSILMFTIVYSLNLINLNKVILMLVQILVGVVFYFLVNILIKNDSLYYSMAVIKGLKSK